MSTSISRSITRFTQKEVEHIFLVARRCFRTEFFDLLCEPRQRSFARILVVASRRVGNAPMRNKIKRQIRAIFYETRLYEQSHDFVIIVRAKACSLKFETLRTLIMEGVKRC